MNEISLFPTCQVRIVRFYVSSSTPLPFSSLRSSPLRFSFFFFFFFFSPPLTFSSSWSFFSLLLSTASHPCQFYLPDSNREHLLLSVRCRTSTAMVCAQCSLPDPNHDQPHPVFATGPQPRSSALSVGCWT